MTNLEKLRCERNMLELCFKLSGHRKEIEHRLIWNMAECLKITTAIINNKKKENKNERK